MQLPDDRRLCYDEASPISSENVRKHQIISRIGRHLAQRYGFVYPIDLETTVLRGWQEFLAGE